MLLRNCFGKSTNKNTVWKWKNSTVEFQTWSCTMSARTCEGLQLILSEILKEKHASATYGSVFPEPGPHGSVIMHINMTCSELGEAAGSLSPSPNIYCISIYTVFYFFWKTSIWWRESETVLAEEPVHAWRQLHQMVVLSSPPSWNEITEIFMPPVRSPAISPAVQHATSSSLHTLIFIIIISFSCSSASPMIKISRSLISRHKKRLSLCSMCARLWLWNVFVHHCRNN